MNAFKKQLVCKLNWRELEQSVCIIQLWQWNVFDWIKTYFKKHLLDFIVIGKNSICFRCHLGIFCITPIPDRMNVSCINDLLRFSGVLIKLDKNLSLLLLAGRPYRLVVIKIYWSINYRTLNFQWIYGLDLDDPTLLQIIVCYVSVVNNEIRTENSINSLNCNIIFILTHNFNW